MEDKDAVIKQLAEENKQLREYIILLEEKIARLEKSSSNSSKPPSSDIIDPRINLKSKRKRKPGGQKGHSKFTRELFTPEQVDKTIIHELPKAEVLRKNLTVLAETEMVLQQVELPTKLYKVIEHRVRLYKTTDGKIIKALLPNDIRKAGLFTTRMTAFAGYLKARCHMSYSTMEAFFADIMDIDISTGFLNKCCTRKLSEALIPAYSDALEHIRQADILGTDETGHNDHGSTLWTWCQRTKDVIFFHINNSRSSKVLQRLLGDDFDGTLTADYFSANRKFARLTNVKVQYCWAHLVRDMKFLAENQLRKVKNWANKLLDIAAKIFGPNKSRVQSSYVRWRNKMEKLRIAFLRNVQKPPDHKDAQNISRRFRDGGKGYFLFLDVAGVEPTNNATEQAIRFVVLDRRVTQGTRGQFGMRWCERAWTVVASCAAQKRSIFEFFINALNSTYRGTTYPSITPQNP